MTAKVGGPAYEATKTIGPTEAPLTLADAPPKTLGLLDQLGLWANLGVSLLGPVGAFAIAYPLGLPRPSFLVAFASVVVGTILGTALVGLAAVPGAQTGAPAMVLLRGLFGARLSALPTVLNVVQCVGWGVFEIFVIAGAADQLLDWHHRWVYIVLAGALTTAMALHPLGAVRTLRRYALVAVTLATVYLFVQFLRQPITAPIRTSWAAFWPGVDITLAVAVSWVPLASDYSRHARSPRAAFAGAFVGYSLTQIAYYTLGLLAFATVVGAHGDSQHVFAAFLAVPFGWLPFAVLVLRELDESFANVYSTVVSVQNLRPLADRRVLAMVLGVAMTGLALLVSTGDYTNFLLLIGSVFVPMFAVFVVDYFLYGGRRHWDVSVSAPPRWRMLLPWTIGFLAYQVVNPGYVSWWARAWTSLRGELGLTPPTWMSASIVSFVVAAALTALVELPEHRRRSRS